MGRPSLGDTAWIGLLGYIAGYDVFAARTGNDTLSMSFWRAIKDPYRRWPTILVWVYLTAHLFHLIPDRWDPLRRVGSLIFDATDSAGGGS